MRYRLRTLLILLAVLPPMLAWYVWPRAREAYIAWRSPDTIRVVKPIQVQWPEGSALRAASLRMIEQRIDIARMEGELDELEAEAESLRQSEVALAARAHQTEQMGKELDQLRAKRAALQTQLANLQNQITLVRSIVTQPDNRLPDEKRRLRTPPGALRFSPEIERAMLHEAAQRK
jgi:predicted metal-dependent hydrolase